MKNLRRAEARYQKRKAKRELKKQSLQNELTYEKLLDPYLYMDANKVCKKGVSWKSEVILYNMNEPFSSIRLVKKLEDFNFKREPLKNFQVNERGKVRDIQAPRYNERVQQRVLCEQILHRLIDHYLIYDNGASQKGKGVSFTRKRLKEHFRSWYRENGNSGYILKMDFSKYFENIQHDKIQKLLEYYIKDKRLIDLIMSFINQYSKGLGLGSQVSQDLAILFTIPIDNLVKNKLRKKYYARYMDDSYCFCKTKEEAKEVLRQIYLACQKLGIIINFKKTKIIKLSSPFTFMHRKYILTKTGKLLIYCDKKSIKREKRKLSKLKKLNLKEAILQSFNSWYGSLEDCIQTKQLRNFKEKIL